VVGKKGERFSQRLQFQVVFEVLDGDREAVEIARAYDLHPRTVARWKKEFLEKGPRDFSRDGTAAKYERGMREAERLLETRKVGLLLLPGKEAPDDHVPCQSQREPHQHQLTGRGVSLRRLRTGRTCWNTTATRAPLGDVSLAGITPSVLIWRTR